jgi:Endomembrane protein 70
VNGDKIVSANVTVSPDHRADITTHDPTHEDVPDLGASKAAGGAHEHGSADAGKEGGATISRLGGGHRHKKSVSGSSQPIKVRFSYSVKFVESDTTYEDRMKVYEESAFLPATLEIHWLSIINSLVLVVLLTAFLGIILLRVVKNDFTRYMRQGDDDVEGTSAAVGGDDASGGETGWKLVHADVFRPPRYLTLFSALVGAGVHLLLMTTLLLSLALFGAFSLARRGSIVAACIILYVLTSFVGGYTSARLYQQLKGHSWVWNVILNLLIVPAPLGATFTILNTTALVKSSSAALPAGTIAVVILLFAFIAIPLTVLGGIAGHHSSEFEPPCRVSKVPRQVPTVPFYRRLPAQLFMAGFLPFSAISIELHYIFASVWGHKVYTLYGILFLAFGLLALVTAFITVALTYFQLASEDHAWWWRSFLSGGSVGAFIYAYCFFYYFNHSGEL